MHLVLKVVLILLLSNAFFTSSYLPDGLLSAKEIGLYIAGILNTGIASYIIISNKFRLRFHWIDILVISYLIILPLIQLWLGYTNSVTNVTQYCTLGFSYLSLRIIFSSLPRLAVYNTFIEVLLITFLISLLIAIFQKSSGYASKSPGTDVKGFLFNSGPFSIHLAALLCFFILMTAITIITKSNRNIYFYLYWIPISLGLFFVALSYSRSAWLGLLFGCIVPILIVFFHKRHHVSEIKLFSNYKSIFLGIVGFSIVIYILLLSLYAIKPDSADGRFLVWKATSQLIKDHWKTGVGVGQFAANYINYQGEVLQIDKEFEKFQNVAGDTRFGFNDYLQTGAELGVIGLILYLAVLVSLSKIVINKLTNVTQWQFLNLSGIVIVIAVSGITAYPMQIASINILMWVTIALLVTITIGRGKLVETKRIHYALLIPFIITCCILSYYAYNKTLSYYRWGEITKQGTVTRSELLDLRKFLFDNAHFLYQLSMVLTSEGDYESAISQLNSAIILNPYPEYYYALGGAYESVLDTSSALKCYKTIQYAIPNLLRPRFQTAQMYYRIGDSVSFRKTAREAILFEPKIKNQEVIGMKESLKIWLSGY